MKPVQAHFFLIKRYLQNETAIVSTVPSNENKNISKTKRIRLVGAFRQTKIKKANIVQILSGHSLCLTILFGPNGQFVGRCKLELMQMRPIYMLSKD